MKCLTDPYQKKLCNKNKICKYFNDVKQNNNKKQNKTQMVKEIPYTNKVKFLLIKEKKKKTVKASNKNKIKFTLEMHFYFNLLNFQKTKFNFIFPPYNTEL